VYQINDFYLLYYGIFINVIWPFCSKPTNKLFYYSNIFRSFLINVQAVLSGIIL